MTKPKVKPKAKNKISLSDFRKKGAAATTPKKTVVSPELQEMVYAQLTDKQFAPISYEGLIKPVTYVTARNGLFKVTKTPIGLFKEKLQSFDSPVYGVGEMDEGVDLVIPKIPFHVIIEALSFYKDVHTKDKTEVSSLYFWNHNNIRLEKRPGLRVDGQLITYVPIQKNSGTLSEFGDDDFVAWLRENTAILLEMHSHHTMGAFFSGTDDANENMTQFYGVWGKINDEEPQFAFRYVVGNTKKEVSPSMLIDWPTFERETETRVKETIRLKGDTALIDMNIPSNTASREDEPIIEVHKEELVPGPFLMVDYPEDWMGQHAKSTPRYKQYNKYAPKNNTYGNYKQTKFPAYGSQTELDLGAYDSFGYGDYGSYGNTGYDGYAGGYYGGEAYGGTEVIDEEELSMYSHVDDAPSEPLKIFLENVLMDIIDDEEVMKNYML